LVQNNSKKLRVGVHEVWVVRRPEERSRDAHPGPSLALPLPLRVLLNIGGTAEDEGNEEERCNKGRLPRCLVMRR
jgi:hypothetical protein